MIHSLSILLLTLAWHDGVETRFEQVYPQPRVKDLVEKTPLQHRAVLLIPGLRLHSFSNTNVHKAQFHDWQATKSHLVQALGKNADVYAFAYAQSVPVDLISQHPALAGSIQRLRVLGYSEIVLIGHSAGGVVARLFVEDNPNAAITRVIQVDAPNLGSSWAKAEITVRKDQEPFLHSLTKEERFKSCQRRANKRIPEQIQFLSVIGSTGNLGDGFVSLTSQWPEDLQLQGIPAVRFATTHFTVIRAAQPAARIAALAVQSQPRWTHEEMAARRKIVLAQPTK